MAQAANGISSTQDARLDSTLLTSSPNSHTSISRATLADVPALALLEMLSFVHDATSAHIYPLRRGLVQSGISPTAWPEYNDVIRRRYNSVAEGHVVLKATKRLSAGGFDVGSSASAADEEIVGFVAMCPPTQLLQPVRTEDEKQELALPSTRDLIGESDTARSSGLKDGVDVVFLERFRAEIVRNRDEIMGQRDYFAINHFLSSPNHQRLGIGTALMASCVQIADEASLPIILESTLVGVPFYERCGFAIVKRCALEYKGEVVEWPVMVREACRGGGQGE